MEANMNDKDYHNDSNKDQFGIQRYSPANVPSTYLAYEEPEEDFHLRDYIAVIMKRKWVVISFLLSVVTITMIFTFMSTPLFKSTVVIRIDRQSRGAPQQQQDDRGINEPDYYQTQYEILKSQTLAETVIKKLDLNKKRDFIPAPNRLMQMMMPVVYSLADAAGSLFISRGHEDAPTVRGAKAPKPEVPFYLISYFIRNLDVIPVKNSQLVQVSFSSSSPELAMNITKAIADSYIEYDLASRLNSSKEAKAFLQNQIELTKAKLENCEKNLNDFASKNGIIYFGSDEGSDKDSAKQSIFAKKLSEISSSLNVATSERMQKEALYNQIKESGAENPIVTNNPLIQELKKQHATLEAEYFNKLKTFTQDYPNMKNLKSQIDALRDSIETEKRNIVKSALSDFKSALKRETYLNNAFAAQQRQMLDLQDKAAQYQTLKREVDVTKGLHNSLLQRFNELGISSMSQATNIQILDNPQYSTTPDKPRKALNFVLSVIFGLMGGIGLTFLIEYFDNTIKDTREIERRINLQSLGMVPFYSRLGTADTPKLVHSGPTRCVSEAFRSIGTFILLSSASKPPKTILITSPGEKEGKTTVSTNVALALAESLGNGVLIDADMRRPKLHSAFAIDNKTGLSSYLSGNLDLESDKGKLVRPTSEKGLSLITAGPIPHNPSKLLHSSKMKDLLNTLSDSYNFIIIDAAPIIGIPDSVLLSKMVDGTILVVKAGETPKNAVFTSKQIFRDVNTNLLGVVLNGVRRDDLKYGYNSSYFSSYFMEEKQTDLDAKNLDKRYS